MGWFRCDLQRFDRLQTLCLLAVTSSKPTSNDKLVGPGRRKDLSLTCLLPVVRTEPDMVDKLRAEFRFNADKDPVYIWPGLFQKG